MLFLPTFRRFLATVLLPLLLPLAAAAATPEDMVLARGVLSVPVSQGVEMLTEEPGEILTPQGVMGPEAAARWSVYQGKTITLPREHRPVWFRFSVRSEAEPGLRWLLAVDWPLLKHVDFHQVDPASGALVASHSAGLALPHADGLLKDPTPPFPVELKPGERTTVLLRVNTDSQFVVPLRLWESKEFHAKRYDRAVGLGLLFGILSVMLVYNLSLFVFTRDRSYLWYTVYLLTIVLYELTVTGYGPFYLWGGSEWLKARGYEFFACCCFLAATYFFRQFLDLKRQARHLYLINQGLFLVFAACLVMSLFPPTRVLNLTFFMGGFASGLAALYTSIYLSLRGNVLARYVAIAWFALVVATDVMLLSLFGVIERSWWTDNAQHLGFVIEIVLLSMALGERIKRERMSREAAQRESLVLARKVEQEREEKLQAQEHALAVQMKANEDLELRVLERTAELKRAMENVELANVELAKLSVTDALTKVHNRRYFDETLKKEHSRSSRTNVPLALLLVDIDHFKQVNDSIGHLGGDECLKLVATTLSNTVGRATDLVARYGGEEFAVVLPSTDAEHALEVAERLRKAVEDIHFIYRGKRIPIQISLGVVAGVVHPSQPVTEFIAQADKALYAAKRAGRNRSKLAANG